MCRLISTVVAAPAQPKVSSPVETGNGAHLHVVTKRGGRPGGWASTEDKNQGKPNSAGTLPTAGGSVKRNANCKGGPGNSGDTIHDSMAAERPSSPGELHPEALTDSGHDRLRSSGSCHPPDGLPTVHGPLRAPPVAGWPDGTVRVTHPLRSLGGYPSSALLRGGPPLTGTLVLSASRVPRWGLFPSHHRHGSPGLPGSPGWSHVPFTPDATWPVNRLPPGCSPGLPSTLVLASSLSLRRVPGDSLTLIAPATP